MVVNKLTTNPEKTDTPLPNPHQLPRVQELLQDAPAFNTRSKGKRDLDVAMCIVEQESIEYANAAVLHPETGLTMKYRQLITHPDFKTVWNRSSANKFGRLAQGIGG